VVIEEGVQESFASLRTTIVKEMDDAGKGDVAMIDLKSMALTMPEVVGHPNRTAFHGVLTTVDAPSQRSPSGAKGHLVMLTKRAAEAALPSLLGMALDYSPTLDRHDVRRKVGVITRAEIVGRNLELGGYLFARDFPEIVQEIAKAGSGRSRSVLDCSRDKTTESATMHAGVDRWESGRWSEGYRLRTSLRVAAKRILSLRAAMREGSESTPGGYGPTIRAEACMATAGVAGLGLSYEVTNVQLGDARAEVWMLEKVTFTGAAILRRDKAAYRDTWIELST
jgi:hypothetical protein